MTVVATATATAASSSTHLPMQCKMTVEMTDIIYHYAVYDESIIMTQSKTISFLVAVLYIYVYISGSNFRLYSFEGRTTGYY